MEADLYVGKRLSYDGHLCTVRYFGEVAGTKGQWIGVEWDDPNRGKHAGKHNEVKYFDCISKHPIAGSFVRPNRPIDATRTFVEAVREKYASDLIAGNGRFKPSEDAVRISGKEVEEIGFDKIRKQLADLQALRIVLVDGLRIARSEARKARGKHVPAVAEDVLHACPQIVELDLSRNLFEECNEIFDICRQLPGLQSLKIDGNRFIPSLPPMEGSAKLPALKSLSLNETFLDWTYITAVCSCFESVQNISASDNGLTKLSLEKLPASCLSLNLQRNNFHFLSDLYPLTKVKNLSSLKLKGNRISQVLDPSYQKNDQDTGLEFSTSVSDIDLSSNHIDSWDVINDLALVFPGMTSLRISNNPLYDGLKASDGNMLTADDGYLLTIARLGRLRRLNFSQITPKERLNADTYYLSQIAHELSATPESETPAILSRHPRYAHLCADYGPPLIQRSIATAKNPNTLAARLILLSISVDQKVYEFAHPGSPFTLELEVPKSLTIYSLLGILGRKLKLRPLELKLVWETGEVDFVQEETDEETYYEDANAIKANGVQSRGLQIQREEVLVPRTRPLGSWIDGAAANIRVEWSEEDRRRFQRARLDGKGSSTDS